MLFYFAVGAQAASAVQIGWPCQRLNWAWRNVWTTCGINTMVPTTTAALIVPATTPGGIYFNNIGPASPGTAYVPLSQVSAAGVFVPQNIAAGATAPNFCTTGGGGFGVVPTANTPIYGGTLQRNRCRRMLDVYGNLVSLCASPKFTPRYGPTGANTNGVVQVADWLPVAAMAPHANNAAALAVMAQQCITPGPLAPTTLGTCPGLMGWFTVFWNSCAGAPGAAPGIAPVVPTTVAPAMPSALWFPDYLSPNAPQPPSTPGGGWQLTTPTNLCGGTPSAFTISATEWNVKGTSFHGTKCRRSIDQFVRTANKCIAQAAGGSDPLLGLAAQLQTNSANCN